MHEEDGTTLYGFGGGPFGLDGGLVYGNKGGIANPTTTPPSQVATLPLGSDPYSNPTSGGVVPYAVEAKSFIVVINLVERFDTTHFTLEDQVELPNSSSGSLEGVRWGQDGLAYVIPTSATGPGGLQPSQVMLIRGPFVLPAEAVANAAPSLTSTDHATIAAGSSNTRVTVSGTGFLPGASALWNGSVRSTTYVDSGHVTVAVPAADLVHAATVTLTAKNPGSSASNSVAINVQ